MQWSKSDSTKSLGLGRDLKGDWFGSLSFYSFDFTVKSWGMKDMLLQNNCYINVTLPNIYL